MVAIKNIEEMPKCCVTYTSENDNYTGCPFYKICKQRETIKTNYKPSDCPLVDIEERKVGKWIKTGGSFRCSECMAMPEFKDIRTLKYCPSCGSKMSDIPTGSEMRGAENE